MFLFLYRTTTFGVISFIVSIAFLRNATAACGPNALFELTDTSQPGSPPVVVAGLVADLNAIAEPLYDFLHKDVKTLTKAMRGATGRDDRAPVLSAWESLYPSIEGLVAACDVPPEWAEKAFESAQPALPSFGNVLSEVNSAGAARRHGASAAVAACSYAAATLDDLRKGLGKSTTDAKDAVGHAQSALSAVEGATSVATGLQPFSLILQDEVTMLQRGLGLAGMHCDVGAGGEMGAVQATEGEREQLAEISQILKIKARDENLPAARFLQGFFNKVERREALSLEDWQNLNAALSPSIRSMQ